MFHENQAIEVTTIRAPYGWMVCARHGSAWCREGIVCDTAITTLLPWSPCHDASHLVFGGPQPHSPSEDITPLHDGGT